MLLEHRTVSRKTPGDGRLEITKPSALRLREAIGALHVELDGERTPASLVSIDCTCRGADNPHEHYLLENSAFRRLTPGSVVDLDLDVDAGLVRVAVWGTTSR